jgi:hypothetical protein
MLVNLHVFDLYEEENRTCFTQLTITDSEDQNMKPSITIGV